LIIEELSLQPINIEVYTSFLTSNINNVDFYCVYQVDFLDKDLISLYQWN